MSRIFISYRRDDSAGYAGRLYDHLRQHFGQDQIFMDIDTIEPGMDFVETIEKAVGSCDVLIALIGQQWLTTSDATGRCRLDNPEDIVRLEIATALDRHIRVIPVLVRGASMPQSSDLPDTLTELARRNALEISDTRFGYDADRLIGAIERVLGEPTLSAPTATPAGVNAESTRRMRTYTVKAGDTLAQIAKAFYGDARLHEIIANANGILDPSLILVGQVLVIPTLREEEPEVKPEEFGLNIAMVGSPFFNKRKERPLVIVNHATANSSLDGLNAWFNNQQAMVSAHFGIGKDGTVVQYVEEAQMAWHAGSSEWMGRQHVNWFSLGIELVNLNDGADPYPEAQHKANVALNAYLCVKWDITPDEEHIITHRDISYHLSGKTDPLGYDMDRLRREVAALVAEHLGP